MLVLALCCDRSYGPLASARSARTANTALPTVCLTWLNGFQFSARAGQRMFSKKSFEREVVQIASNRTKRPSAILQCLCAGGACATIRPVESITSCWAYKTCRLIFDMDGCPAALAAHCLPIRAVAAISNRKARVVPLTPRCLMKQPDHFLHCEEGYLTGRRLALKK